MELVSNDLVTMDEDVEVEDIFTVDVYGYEGPLHLLLDLSRKQKVDLLHVSILELATQYLGFIQEAQDKRIDLAADYLLMAAWLAYLKSRLLLPKPKRRARVKPPPRMMLSSWLSVCAASMRCAKLEKR